MSSMRWGGGQPAVGVSVQPPAALMHSAMMGPADQGQVGQVGGAAMQPVLEMMGLRLGWGTITAGDRTAAVVDHQGGLLGGGHQPAGPAHLQWLGRGPAQDRGQPGQRGLEPGGHPAVTPQAVLGTEAMAVGVVAMVVGVVVAGVEVGAMMVVAMNAGVAGDQRLGSGLPSQASRRHASGASGPAQPIPHPGCRDGPAGCPGPR